MLVGDYSDDSIKTVLLNTSSGDIVPLPGIKDRVYLTTSGSGGIVFYTDLSGKSVWRFDVSTPNAPATLVKNVSETTQGITVDQSRGQLFVSLDRCCIKSLDFDGSHVQDVVTEHVEKGYGLAVDSINM